MPTPAPAPVLDVVVPVHDEEATLTACVERLHAHLVHTFPYPFRITVADNASTDGTWRAATRLAAAVPEVEAVHVGRKGRGRALKQVWSASPAPVLAYMDVDLSTDLDALWPLVAPLMSGHSDLATGSRLHRDSRVVRGTRREVISRCYNLLLGLTLGARFSDAQCGFKAIRKDVADALLPLVEDPTWFFDTELLVLAERCGLRIAEVPVDWYDDPDSRVDVVGTAVDDLRGVWRVRRALTTGRLPVERIRERMGRGAPEPGPGTAGAGPGRAARVVAAVPRDLGGQVARFAGVGVVSTVIHLGLFAALRAGASSAQVANLVALLVATVANTALNRRWTFRVRGRRGAVRHQLQGLAVFGLTLAASAAALSLLHVAAPGAPTWAETATIAVANAVSTAVRFVAMRTWMFVGHAPGGDPGAGGGRRPGRDLRLVAEPASGRRTEGRLRG